MAVNIPFCEEKSWNKCFLSMWEAFVNPFHFVRQVPVYVSYKSKKKKEEKKTIFVCTVVLVLLSRAASAVLVGQCSGNFSFASFNSHPVLEVYCYVTFGNRDLKSAIYLFSVIVTLALVTL